MKVVPDIPKRRLGLPPRLADENFTFATYKIAHHLRAPPPPAPPCPPTPTTFATLPIRAAPRHGAKMAVGP